MRWILLGLLAAAACGTHPSTANDDDPRFCSENYPHEQAPELCESSSYGDCCSWEIEADGETCRHDYCSFYSSTPCQWELQYTECH
jgi:hypothetical protein